ncbi:NAD-dependent epimerase/dehydratase family protein (plasmid) [Sphingobium sp. JS3065]|uniref:NAD-dependent epimerase/dehydratase family protein n=1 Tax=Sphingobium sp. JS3065 TaxID=2970925 RepID=UPI002263CAA3|nr:NAD-dependent epimerase/dehydratase family protein [Sphingobium sp. JS3065]UZW58062.1 NAD-dependent epimerase/dehydratase family protein [Sphingobium sp. JS3065]
MRIAVVGARGFVGRHLTRFLSNQGINAVLISRNEVASGTFGTAIAGCDALVNCAGNKEGLGTSAREANVELPLRLLAAVIAADIPAMIQVSSVAALASSSGPGEIVTDNFAGWPTGVYGRSKREGDDALLQAAYERSYSALVVLRPPILIGPDAGGVFALLRSAARAGIPLPLHGIENRRSFMHVDNFAAAILAAARARCSGAFIVTDSPPLSSADLYARMLAAVGYQRRLFSIGRSGRAILRNAMGRRGESLFGDAAYSGARFEAAVQVAWPIPASMIVERALEGIEP